MNTKTQKLSFVIPCYGSGKTIETIVNSIIETVSSKNPYEIICVNDNSPDNVFSVLCRLAENNTNIKVIDLAKNFGQHNALLTGYHYASGDIIISLDDDGQTPPSECYKLINAIDKDYDVIYARYNEKKHSLFRNFGAWTTKVMGEILLDIPKNLYGSSYFACKRFIIDEIKKYEYPYTFLGGLILRTTKNIGNVDITHYARQSGTSGYTLKKLISLWLNAFTAFSVRPLRIASYSGFLCSIIGFVYAIYIIISKIINPEIVSGYSSLMSIILFIGGLIMLMLGIVGEYIGRIYICINNSPQSVIRNTVNVDKEKK